MVVTRNWIVENYNKYNDLIFLGALPKIDVLHFNVEVNHSKCAFGLCCTRYRNGKVLSRTIKMSNYLDRTEADLVDTLVHEMIHLYIGVKNMKDTSPHGVIFKRIMRELNAKYDLHMSVRKKTDITEGRPNIANPTNEVSTIFTLECKDGRYFISKANEKYINSIDREAKRWSGCKDIRWYKSKDPIFNEWAKVRKLRGQVVSKDKFEKFVTKLAAEKLNNMNIRSIVAK
jgi:hypothetical protein